ncbi:unnamed protein product [Bemisia tabaci]|uniref:RRM domain-containing protein n=1 Tax=Bemisia tabaci TaxID=7038 RepID=A0A9P0F5N4_BEMTA|nr:PREDICTED: RNA-binding protein with serine-rich domain 1-B-like [Bemisia tabaci]XP_018910094.1 PREDICTED: RNA-binding protein with serine-rich domain 1-B-like [Bemisia tabaci]CAH0390742.1 unnamed protein product [Bemisia tabaci]
MSSSHDDTSDKENKEKKNEDPGERTRKRTDSRSSRSSGSSGRSSSSGSDSSSGSSSSGSSSRSDSRSSRSSSSSSSVAADASSSTKKQETRKRSVSRSPRRSASIRQSRSPGKRNVNPNRRSPSRSPDRRYRKDNLKKGRSGRNDAESDRPRSVSPKRRRKRTPSPKPPRVYVSKLTRNVHKEHVNEIFSNYGQIKILEMPMFRQYNGFCNKGFAYVEFETLESANKALRMDGGQIDGQEVAVELADFTHQATDIRRLRTPPPQRNDFFPRGGRGWRRGPRFFPRGRMRSPPRRWSPIRQPRRRSRSPIRHRQYSRSSSDDSR